MVVDIAESHKVLNGIGQEYSVYTVRFNKATRQSWKERQNQGEYLLVVIRLPRKKDHDVLCFPSKFKSLSQVIASKNKYRPAKLGNRRALVVNSTSDGVIEQ